MSRLYLFPGSRNHKGYFIAQLVFFFFKCALSSFAFIRQMLACTIPFKLIIITLLGVKRYQHHPSFHPPFPLPNTPPPQWLKGNLFLVGGISEWIIQLVECSVLYIFRRQRNPLVSHNSSVKTKHHPVCAPSKPCMLRSWNCQAS